MSAVSPTGSVLSPRELENLGVLFVGFVSATVLYGLTFFQTYIYYSRFPRDSRWIRYFVAALCTLDTTATALLSQVLYYYLITLFDVNMEVLYASTTFCFQYMLSVLLTFISQLFFAYRVFQVTRRSWLLTLAPIFLSFIALVFGLAATAQMFTQRRLSAFGTLKMEITFAISLGSSVMADLVVFATMCSSLRWPRFPEMLVFQKILAIVITALVGRGLAFTVVQAVYFAVFLAAPSRQYWIPLQMIACKIYVNTLLGQLISRTIYQGQGVNEEDSLTDRKLPRNGGPRASIRFDTDAKGTTQSVHFATRHTDTESDGTGLDSGKSFQDAHGNTHTEMTGVGVAQSQTGEEADKGSLSRQL